MSYPINKFTTILGQSNNLRRLLLISIGNPSPKYDSTRHSAGHIALNQFIKELGGIDERRKISNKSVEVAPLSNHPDVYIAKSLEFMNNSGRAVIAARKHVGDCTWIVMHDDLDSQIGTAKFKLESRQMGAHNGLGSICKEKIPFPRIRLGIGSPESRAPGLVASYVMSKFPTNEYEILKNQTVPAALEYFKKIIEIFEKSVERERKKQRYAAKLKAKEQKDQ